LRNKEKDEYTAAEEFVWKSKEEGDIAFFPVGQAISIAKKQ
jgi:hypothetical protein